MKKYSIKSISVHKTPGLRKGLQPMELASNINLIAGPNASGKSSTARAIQHLFWKPHASGLNIEASIFLDRELWEVKIDSTHRLVQREGLDDELQGIPAMETSNRYLLALHDLVSESEADLAGQMANESIGGVSLEEAQKTLGYSTGIPNKGRTEYKNLINAQKRLSETAAEQEALKKEEDRLQELEKRKKQSAKAQQLYELYSAKHALLKATQEVDLQLEKKKQFPECMEVMTGEEHVGLTELQEQVQSFSGEMDKAEERLETSRERLKQLRIIPEGLGTEKAQELRERMEHLKDLTHRLEQLAAELQDQRTTESAALQRIGKGIDPSALTHLNFGKVKELDEFVQQAQSVLAERNTQKKRLEQLEKEIEETGRPIADPWSLRKGIKTLSLWLKEPEEPRGIPRIHLIIMAALGALIALTTLFLGAPALLGLLFIAGYLLFSLRTSSPKSSERAPDWASLELPAPRSWEAEAVMEHLETLNAELQKAEKQTGLQAQLEIGKETLKEKREALERMRNKKQDLLEEVGIQPETLVWDADDFGSFYWFLRHCADWQQAYTASQALEAQVEITRKCYGEELERMNQRFEALNFSKAIDTPQASATLREILSQEDLRKEETRKIDETIGRLSRLSEDHRTATAKSREIYRKLQLEEGELDQVQNLCRELPDYREACQNLYAAAQRAREKESNLIKHPLYHKQQELLEELNLDQVEAGMETYALQAQNLEHLNAEITKIQTLVENKKQGQELEDMLSGVENAKDELRELYQNNLKSAAGALLLEQLKEETRDQNRPKVFKRAQQLLNRITNGRYELLLDERGSAAFGARDTVLRKGQQLAELSTGTRVQLLLAVRLAYIESMEKGIKLPILADELLANSDDERAAAIIQALVEISKEGRQIFYFTAQDDEVAKWKAIMEQHPELDSKILSLSNGTEPPFVNDASLPDPVVFLQSAPPPGKLSHEAYGRELKVPPFNPLDQECSELHLWYVLKDPALLYTCLRRGIRQWGQLESFHRNKGQLQGFNETLWLRLSPQIKLLETYIQLVRKGRPGKIDREVLEKSGAVSGSFMKEVAALLERLEGNPAQLLEALKNGTVSGFRKNKIEELELFLIGEGHLDRQDIMQPGEIQLRLNAMASQLGIEPKEAQDFFENILNAEHLEKHLEADQQD